MNEVELHGGSQPTANVEFSAATDGIVVGGGDDKDWVSLNELGGDLGLPRDGNQPQTISERIAQVSADPSLNHPVSDDNSRNSSCPTSPKRRRRSHHLRLADFV